MGDCRPNLFLLGAPKCGTTAMQSYLSQLPDIYVPSEKPPRFFASDFSFPNRVSEEEYISHFKDGSGCQYLLDASVWNLASKSACAEISLWNSSARAIVMLRNPADVLFALHNEFLWEGVETCATLREALSKEKLRMHGEELPSTANFRNVPFFPEMLQYRNAVQYVNQLDRAWGYFGKENVFVILHDDLKADTTAVFKSVCAFLGLEMPTSVDMKAVNQRKKTRSRFAQRLLLNPPPIVRSILTGMITTQQKRRFYCLLRQFNTRSATEKEKKVDKNLRGSLQQEFTTQITTLGEMLDRDLSGWLVKPQQS